jgi:hypothetical protein
MSASTMQHVHVSDDCSLPVINNVIIFKGARKQKKNCMSAPMQHVHITNDCNWSEINNCMNEGKRRSGNLDPYPKDNWRDHKRRGN